MRDRDEIRVGGVGTGRIFQHAHMRVYPKLIETTELVGFFDLNRARAVEACERYAVLLEAFAADCPEHGELARHNAAHLRVFDSLEETLAAVDVVDVATHARGRMATAIAALERGVHVMVEKPMARVWTEADRAVRAAARHPEVLFQLNDDNAFDPKYRVLHDLIASGSIGQVQHVSLIRGSQFDSTSVLRSQASALDNGGGCLMDYGSHGLAGVWYALGLNCCPERVEAVKIATLFPHRVLEGEPRIIEVDDEAQIKVLFEDADTGAWSTVFLEATWSGGHIGLGPKKSGGQADGYVRMIGDEGIVYTHDAKKIAIERWDGGREELPLQTYPGERISFDDQIGGFLKCVRSGGRPEIDVRFGSEIIAVCGAAYLSAIRGQAVTLDEFKAYCEGFVETYGDGEQADDALVRDLLTPYRYAGDVR